jgi:fucose permease
MIGRGCCVFAVLRLRLLRWDVSFVMNRAGGVGAVNPVLYLAFAATGVGIAVPGVLLPVLLVRWSMQDGMAGVLLFLLFLGTTSGALVSRGRMRGSVVRGCVVVAVGAVGLGTASRGTALAAMLVYGVGQGMVMTSVSLLQSRRYPLDRTAQIARLNLVWSVAAVMGPWLVLRCTDAWGIRVTLGALAGLFVVAGLMVMGVVRDASGETAVERGGKGSRWAGPGLLLVLIPLATGIESAAGGWLATYSKRMGHTFGAAAGVATCFWAGMLVSRLVQSQRRAAMRLDRAVFRVHPWVLVVALGMIVGFRQEGLVLAGALLLGLGIGPLYPQMLSRVLSYGEGGNTVFMLAGCGASVLPLLTGLVSSWTGSLRAGLGVPLAGAVVMGCVAVVVSGRERDAALA